MYTNINNTSIFLNSHCKLLSPKSLIKINIFDKPHKRHILKVQNTANEEIKLTSAKSAIEKGIITLHFNLKCHN